MDVRRNVLSRIFGIEKETEYINLAKKRINNIRLFFDEADWVEESKAK
jgi:DNA modification methylase